MIFELKNIEIPHPETTDKRVAANKDNEQHGGKLRRQPLKGISVAEVVFFLSSSLRGVVVGTKDSIAEYVFVCSLRHKIYNYLDKASQDSGATKE